MIVSRPRLAKLALSTLVAAALLIGAPGGAALDGAELSEPCGPTPCACPARSGDEIWWLDTRCLPCLPSCGDGVVAGAIDGLKFRRYDATTKRWQTSDREEFFAGPHATWPTCIWVHGDRIDDGKDLEVGWDVYRQLVHCVGTTDPIRFVIWSWPSQKEITGPYRDAAIKAERAIGAGYRLGWVLSEMPRDVRVSLFGFSFGARVITVALQFAAGGALSGYTLPESQVAAGGYHVALMAAAIDNDWLIPGRRHGRALEAVGEILLLNNGCDWILKRYPKFHHRRSGRDALGYTGMVFHPSVAPFRDRIREVDACQYLGKEHAWRAYIYTPATMELIRQAVLWDIVTVP